MEAEPGEARRSSGEGEVADESEPHQSPESSVRSPKRIPGGDGGAPTLRSGGHRGGSRGGGRGRGERRPAAGKTEAEAVWMPRSQKIPRERSRPTMSAVCRRAAVGSPRRQCRGPAHTSRRARRLPPPRRGHRGPESAVRWTCLEATPVRPRRWCGCPYLRARAPRPITRCVSSGCVRLAAVQEAVRNSARSSSVSRAE